MKNNRLILLVFSYFISISFQLKETINNIEEVYSYKENGNKIGKKEAISLALNYDSYFGEKSSIKILQLYSIEQTINVKDGKDSYELNFTIDGYNNEQIYLYKGLYCTLPLNNCKSKNGEIKCIMPKSVLDEITEDNGDYFAICYLTNDNSFLRYEPIQYVYINYLNVRKERIYVGITQLIENVTDIKSFVAYETNVTNISRINSDLEKFKLSFNDNQEFECGFKKYDNYPLLLLCFVEETGTFRLSEIKNEINLTNININYEFLIQPVYNKETFVCKNRDFRYGYVRYVFSEILDFSSTDSLTIEYYFDKQFTKGLTYNKNSPDLKCERSGKIQKCIVPKSHFEGKSGYYFIMHENHLNGKSFSYEGQPIKVILNGSNNTNKTFIIIISIIGVIIILALIIFLICFCRKKVKSSDIEVSKETSDIGL